MAEAADRNDETIEGWPMGIIEALQFLRKRGILLGVISKNDASTVEGLWDEIFRGRLRLDDFVVRKINWRPKAENLEAIFHEVNLSPGVWSSSTTTATERAAVQSAFPEVRVLGAQLYHLKRVLMWSTETQTPSISDESARRSEMVQRHIEHGEHPQCYAPRRCS